jgi:hypothetical protein
MKITLSKSAQRLVLSALVSGLGFGACRYMQKPLPEPLPISRRLTWEGLPPVKYAAFPAMAADSGSGAGRVGIHEFEFAGTDSVRLRLDEYDQAFLAYAAFQNHASRTEMSEGFYHKGDNLVFYQGSFSGELRFTHGGTMPTQFLKEKLSFQGEPLFLVPPEFTFFPLLGRIPHSERVIEKHFLGRLWHGPVFSVSYRCHDDTATAFRANAQDFHMVDTWFQEWNGRIDTIGQGREVRFQGWDELQRPLVFWVFPEAVIGVEGCFDTELALDYTRKMEKMRAMWTEP